MKKTLIAIPVIALMIGCGSVEITEAPTSNAVDPTDTIEQTIDEEEPAVEEVVETQSIYEQGFDTFKEAIKNKDIQGVSAFASSDAIDAEEVLMYFGDQEFMDKLMSMTYADLRTEESDAGQSMVCSVNVSGETDGEVFESAIVLYFTEGESSLELDMVMAAG
jgi:hypothetical protein